jgi:hypothetical protein
MNGMSFTQNSPTGTTNYLYDGRNLLEEVELLQ